MKLNITLPWPPSSNTYWRYVNNRVITSKKAREYKDLILKLSYTWGNVLFHEERLSIDIKAHPPDKRKRDLDNLLKVTIDAIASTGIFQNDSQIDKLIITREHEIKPGTLKVEISKISTTQVVDGL